MKRLIDADIAKKRISKIMLDAAETKAKLKADYEIALAQLDKQTENRVQGVLMLYETEYDETQKVGE